MAKIRANISQVNNNANFIFCSQNVFASKVDCEFFLFLKENFARNFLSNIYVWTYLIHDKTDLQFTSL
jgi:hypothetical protein